MKVFNGSLQPVVLRSFVGNVWAQDFKLVMPTESEILFGPDLLAFGIKEYPLPGILVVKDSGYVQIDLKEACDIVVLRRDKPSIFMRASLLSAFRQEGVAVVHHDQLDLIGF